jgi:uncharacterized protein YndB with AHSA1/START domain
LTFPQGDELVHSFRMLYQPELAADDHSRVTWQLDDEGNGVTKLTVSHDQLREGSATFEHVAEGWNWILSNMKTLLETGRSLPHEDLSVASLRDT